MTVSKGKQRYPRQSRDDVGQTYGRLTVLAYGPPTTGGALTLTCQCICGHAFTGTRSNIRLGKTTSCGCYHREQTVAANKRHGYTGKRRHPLYGAWRTMIARCHNPNAVSYHQYGALGVEVDPRWRTTFATFLADMGERPTPQHSLDRWPNPNGPYAPGNTRWATLHEQRRNWRVNQFVTYQGRAQLLTDWARELGLPFSAMRWRLKQGWTPEQAFTTPLRPDKRRGATQQAPVLAR